MAATRRVKRIPKVIAARADYLDPVGCDSTVSYKIVNGSRRLWANMQLSDCSRKIEWYFGGRPKEALAKLDKAVALFSEFRNALSAALTAQRKRTRRRKITK